MKEWLSRLTRRPAVAHLLRAYERYTIRLGDQFAGAITYFSVLALVPIAMFVFSVLGFILVEVRPDLIDALARRVSDLLGGGGKETQDKIIGLVNGALQNYAAVGVIGLLSAMYAGASWANNLKKAVRAQWRPTFDQVDDKQNFLLNILANLGILLGLLVAMVVTFGLASVSTSLSSDVVQWLGLNEVRWLAPALKIVPVIFSVAAGWLLFMYLFTVLPAAREPWSAVRRGALIGACGLALLQYLTSSLLSKFTSNAAVAVFGPVIAVMLFLNLFARLVLVVAAWIAVTDRPAVAEEEVGERVRFVLSAPGPAAEPATVHRDVAARSVQVGMGAGYVTGAATGVGVGAALAVLASRLRRTPD
ncbi:MAG: tRNA-processing ribonuclease [Propionibacteriaceae bacterium]|nr:tRNA-processing ribonuclease [Propionibacteriaceae bacterium]